ncbi:Protein FREE1 [Vitis vinifera]|uniref:Protein FREE1 n=1 Tax=Vitis vinifera TaxID=29760 RepID=A0A438E490_VITVI|nr:Protein FREE1 [Vitis vinifera]RVX03394.1 Protein FREE1 [Vitis vinifera]
MIQLFNLPHQVNNPPDSGRSAEVTQRLSNAKEAANKPALQSHEDLARKLQEEMERNRKASSGPMK